MVNKVTILGRVGKTPEVKYLEGGMAVAKLTIATTEKYKNAKGEVVESTEWHNVTAWRKLAEIIEKYVQKGQLLYIEGKIKYSKSEKDGKTSYFTEIVANELKMFPKAHNSGSQETTEAKTESQSDDAEAFPDDLPF